MLIKNLGLSPLAANGSRKFAQPERLDTREGIKRTLAKTTPLTGPERIALQRYYINSKAGAGNSAITGSTAVDLEKIEEKLEIESSTLNLFTRPIAINGSFLPAKRFNSQAIDVLNKAGESAISQKEGFIYTSNVLWSLLSMDKEIAADLTKAGVTVDWFKDLAPDHTKLALSYDKPKVSNGIKDGLHYLLAEKKSRINNRDLLNISLSPNSDVGRILKFKGNGLIVSSVREKLGLGPLPYQTNS